MPWNHTFECERRALRSVPVAILANIAVGEGGLGPADAS
jgi:hypothetical protein